MSDTTTSLDIQKGEGTVLDIARVFPMTVPRALDLARHGRFIDGMIAAESSNTIDLSIDAIIRIKRFSTLDMLDIALPEIVDPALWEKGMFGAVARPRRIDIVPPLYVPYGALDVRRENMIYGNITYPDLFTRKLPYGLFVRRIKRSIQGFFIHHQKRIFMAIVAFVLFSIPILSYVAYALNHGYTILENLADQREPATIRDMVRSARGDFERSSFLLTPFSWIPLAQVDSIDRATAGGLALTRGLDLLMQSLPSSMSATGAVVKKDAQDPLSYRTASRDIFPMEGLGIQNPSDWIRENHTILEKARDELTQAGVIYGGVTQTGDRTMRMQKIGKTITKITNILDWSIKNQDNILNMLGDINPQRYIVFNQNRDEIRANGGFPGSILSFTLYKGNILDYRADDVYYYDWNLYPYKEIPPPGIALLTDTYGLRDVNYYPDFHDTLDKANRFIEKSGEATVTTAVAIHQGIIEDVLAKVGPVKVPGVTMAFDEKNFSLLMSTLVENKYAKDNTPKDVLFQFAGALMTKIREKNAPLELLDIFTEHLTDGEILFASRDKGVDEFLETYQKKLPWKLAEPNWIYPIWTSVSGNKSDRYIKRTYQATTRRVEDCKYENTITLGTKHTYAKADSEELLSYFKEFSIIDPNERAKLDFIQGNGKNRAYVRVYVPLGAKLLGGGLDIATTSNEEATVFSLLIETPVGATTSKSWKYVIDIPNCVNYNSKIEWTRQPGLREVIIK